MKPDNRNWWISKSTILIIVTLALRISALEKCPVKVIVTPVDHDLMQLPSIFSSVKVSVYHFRKFKYGVYICDGRGRYIMSSNSFSWYFSPGGMQSSCLFQVYVDPKSCSVWTLDNINKLNQLDPEHMASALRSFVT